MKPAIVVASLMAWAFFSPSSLLAQKPTSKSLAELIWTQAIPRPDSSSIEVIEAELIRLSALGTAVNCRLMQDELSSLAAILRGGAASKLYPDIFITTETPCPQQEPFGCILIGDAFYVNEDFEYALTYYRLAAEGLAPDEEAHLTATLNAGACLISLGKYREAIPAFQQVIDHPFERADAFQSLASINLSAAQLNAGLLKDAESTIRGVPVGGLSDYWKGVHYSNGLIVYQKLGEYEKSDSVWQHHLRAIPFPSLPDEVHPYVLSELLSRGDYLGFAQFRNQILASRQSPLLDPDHSHHLLFDLGEHVEDLYQIWSLYRDFETTQRRANVNANSAAQLNVQSELQLLQSELQEERQLTRNWKMGATAGALGLMAVVLVLQFMRSRQLQRNLKEMRAMEEVNLPQQQRVDEEDWVALVQALTYGKGLKKALLIALRMRAEFAGQTGSDLNLEAISGYDELNEREKEVAAHIASGMTSSEIADLLHVSTKYTYNIRSRIRFKLGVPDEEDLLEWLREASLQRQA